MARPIVLSNGELHVGLNNYGLVHDLYFPYVGLENHAAGDSLYHHIGVWADGCISWLDNGEWEVNFSYPHQALIGHITAKNPQLGIVLEFDDMVDAEYNALLRNIHVVNLTSQKRSVRLFMHQAFNIGDSASSTDTAQYLPDDHAMLHYRGRRAFIISGQQASGQWFNQHTCGLFGSEGRDGTWRDAEDGQLVECNVEHGRVDSTLGFTLRVEPHGSCRLTYWVACGTSMRQALKVHRQLQKQGFRQRFEATASSWHQWLRLSEGTVSRLPQQYKSRFIESLMLLKAHIDKRGAIISSTDTEVTDGERDVYGYAWPRDGAYAVWPLIRLGYYDEPYRFFEFCRRALNPGGYLSHKYRADGALGSSWYPYLHENGEVTPPIQSDETALVLFVFAQFYNAFEDEKLLHDFYQPLVVPMADFLASFINPKTGLPKPSYDIWSERFMTTLYTTAATCAALQAAARLAEKNNDTASAVKWRNAADTTAGKARQVFYNQGKNVFYRGFKTNKDGSLELDATIDMSGVYGAFLFGLYAINSAEVKNSIGAAKAAFGFNAASPGVPRYQNDNYRRAHSQQPNYWPVVSLWMAQYAVETGDKPLADKIIAWVASKMHSTSTISEQVCSENGANTSVEPHVWSQAEYLSTLLDIVTEEQ